MWELRCVQLVYPHSNFLLENFIPSTSSTESHLDVHRTTPVTNSWRSTTTSCPSSNKSHHPKTHSTLIAALTLTTRGLDLKPCLTCSSLRVHEPPGNLNKQSQSCSSPSRSKQLHESSACEWPTGTDWHTKKTPHHPRVLIWTRLGLAGLFFRPAPLTCARSRASGCGRGGRGVGPGGVHTHEAMLTFGGQVTIRIHWSSRARGP